MNVLLFSLQIYKWNEYYRMHLWNKKQSNTICSNVLIIHKQMSSHAKYLAPSPSIS